MHRSANFLRRSGLIPEPSLKALTRACLSIVSDNWSRLEKENCTQCIGGVVEVEAESLSQQPVNRRTCRSMEADPDSNWPRISNFWIDASFFDTVYDSASIIGLLAVEKDHCIDLPLYAAFRSQ